MLLEIKIVGYFPITEQVVAGTGPESNDRNFSLSFHKIDAFTSDNSLSCIQFCVLENC